MLVSAQTKRCKFLDKRRLSSKYSKLAENLLGFISQGKELDIIWSKFDTKYDYSSFAISVSIPHLLLLRGNEKSQCQAIP